MTIDGRYRTTIDRRRPSFALVPRIFTRSGHGPHRLQVSILAPDPGHPVAVGTGVDAIEDVNGTRSAPVAARWAPQTAPSAAGGRFVVSGVAGARASFRFRGSAVTITTATGPGYGRAEIWVDGTLRRRLDLSAAATTFGVTRSVGGLADLVHSVRVVVLGLPGKAGTGTAVAIDGWSVA